MTLITMVAYFLGTRDKETGGNFIDYPEDGGDMFLGNVSKHL
jgi:hypothetical protein